ncbi:MAG: 2-succinyl-5-enolpyruvyl-6-hydroxy-3-cyclohexene-carboxylic-acid synthase [Actinomycetota bacterium]
MSQSQRFAAELIGQLASNGVKDFYLAPGARSQALAIAIRQLQKAGHANLTVRIDERSLGFTALGRALESKSPSVLITTSGTAVANLHPAVLEAHHAGVPLIVLSADRPGELRGKGANQTTNQVGIFADALRLMVDADCSADATELAQRAVDAARGNQDRPGPVQLNLQFSEPLAAAEPLATEYLTVPKTRVLPSSVSELEVSVAARAIVIAGAGGEGAAAFAKQAGLPLLAEPTSGARCDTALQNYSELLKQKLTEVEQVFVFGKPTLSRSVIAAAKAAELWVQKSENYELFSIGDPAGVADKLIPSGHGDPLWVASWNAEPESSPRADLVAAVWSATEASDLLLFGASELIRVADRSVPAKNIRAFANRGLAGIDGTVSTALGLAQSGSQVRAVIGDLTLLHDAGGLNLSGLPNLDCQLIVGNDQGGKIFSHLEMAQLVDPADFDLLFTTPQRVDFEALANAYGWQYFKTSPAGLSELLSNKGFVLIEVEL